MSQHSPEGTGMSQGPWQMSPEPPPSPAQEPGLAQPRVPTMSEAVAGSCWQCLVLPPTHGECIWCCLARRRLKKAQGESEGKGGTGAADPAHPVSSGQLCRLCAKGSNRAWAEWYAWGFVQPGAPLLTRKYQGLAAREAVRGEKIKFLRKNENTAGKVKVATENMKHH